MDVAALTAEVEAARRRLNNAEEAEAEAEEAEEAEEEGALLSRLWDVIRELRDRSAEQRSVIEHLHRARRASKGFNSGDGIERR